MSKGFLKLYRQFFQSELWKEGRAFSNAEAFLDLLQLAAHAHTKLIVRGQWRELTPGQLCASQRYLSRRWGWSTTKVRQYIALLEADGIVQPQKNRESTIITICRYRESGDEAVIFSPEKNHRETSEKPPGNQIEEGKERLDGEEPKKKRKVAAIAPLPDVPFSSETFVKAWEEWLKYRQAKRRPVTSKSAEMTFEDFRAWGETASVEAIRHSMKCDYQGVFPAKRPAAVASDGTRAKGRKPESYNDQPRLLPD